MVGCPNHYTPCVMHPQTPRQSTINPPSNPHKSHRRFSRICSTITLAALSVSLLSCASTNERPEPTSKHTIIAMVNAQPVYDHQLWPTLSELAGKQALDELILTRLLDQHAQQSGWTITDHHIQSELDALITTLDQSATPETSPLLIESIRRRRGLGPQRFTALLRRNAILRRMIVNDPAIESRTQQELQAALDSIATTPTQSQLDQFRNRARLVAEQTAMESKARSLLDQADVLVMDRSIKWSGE